MSDHHEEEALGKAYDARLARRLLHYFRPYKWQVLFALALTLGVAPLEAVGPYLFKIAVDSYLVPATRGAIGYSAAYRGIEWVTAIFLATLVASFALQYLQVRVMQRVGQETMYDLRKEIFAHLQRLPMSFYDRSPVGRLLNRERKAGQTFEKLNRNHMLAFKDAILAFALFYPVVEFLGVASVALLFWFGGLRVLAGSVEIGVLVAFMQYAQRFFRPIQDLSEKFNVLQSAMASSERIFKLLDEPVTIASPAEALALRQPRGEVEFRDVWFAYRGGDNPTDEDWVLRNVSFRVEPGQTVAIVGHTGAGKTTVIQLLLRFYDIQRGQILLDGIDIRKFNLQELRQHFGIVLQDPFLFSGTLESNVCLGTEGIDRAAVESAVAEVGLGEFVQSLAGGVTVPVTERGATFSVGQRQLIGFARALAHNPRFLILDEATSSVDTKTELLIREALDRLLAGRTALVIAHRLSTIQHADRILVFHKGRLREQGSHQELLAQRGIYYRLYQLQYKDQELRFQLPVADATASTSLPADD